MIRLQVQNKGKFARAEMRAVAASSAVGDQASGCS
jgi:hypothetical protein